MLTKNAVIRVLFSAVFLAVGLCWLTSSIAQQGYDSFGYNYLQRKFYGIYENADRDMSNNTGDQTRLQVEWNDLFNISQPQASKAGAWVTNSQGGTYVGEDGKTYRWAYTLKIKFTGPGSPLWGFFSKEDENYFDSGRSPTLRNKPPVLPVPGS